MIGRLQGVTDFEAKDNVMHREIMPHLPLFQTDL